MVNMAMGSKIFYIVSILFLLVGSQASYAGAKISIDETKWISIGIGAKASFSGIEDSAPNGHDFSTDFDLDNARIYINGQIHEYLKFEFNTECIFCNNSALRELAILDAVAKFELDPAFNIWAGRVLVPAHRAEMSGPFFVSTYEGFKTPFYPSDFSVDFGTGGAGVFARDHGFNVWGTLGDQGRLLYVFGVFDGLNSAPDNGPNQDDSFLYASRVSYNFWNIEKNPGYYTSSTYYGNAGDILTLGYAVQYQEDGSGSFSNPGDFLGMSVDLLMEKVLSSGVLTLEGEYKYFDAEFNINAFNDSDCFCMFDGNAWTATALFLSIQDFGIGKLQPYVRYSGIDPTMSSSRKEYEAGLNYVIDGHNARLSLFYQYGDIATKSIVNFSPNVTGDDVSKIMLGVQFQL